MQVKKVNASLGWSPGITVTKNSQAVSFTETNVLTILESVSLKSACQQVRHGKVLV